MLDGIELVIYETIMSMIIECEDQEIFDRDNIPINKFGSIHVLKIIVQTLIIEVGLLVCAVEENDLKLLKTVWISDYDENNMLLGFHVEKSGSNKKLIGFLIPNYHKTEFKKYDIVEYKTEQVQHLGEEKLSDQFNDLLTVLKKVR
jgi:hypothetical protein